jgi:hypothetical protein
MRRALRSINGTIATERTAASSLLHTRAAIHLQLLHPRLALHDAKTALHLREQAHDTPSRLGEAEGTLAWALAANLRLQRALDYATRGVAKLRTSPPTGFTIRAMRKLGILQAANLRFKDALSTLDEATVLADDLKFMDQASQLRAWTRHVRRVTRLLRVDCSGPRTI